MRIAVYKNDGEHGKKLDLGPTFDGTEAEAYASHGSDYGRSATVDWMEIPEGLDARELVAVEDTPGVIELQSDPTKKAEMIAQDHGSLITEKYNEMNTDVYGEMKTVFGTTKSDSASRNYETWKRMKEVPAMFSGEGLVSDRQLIASDDETILFELDDALNTDEKITQYATRLLELADAYAVFVMKRIKQFKDEKAAILDS